MPQPARTARRRSTLLAVAATSVAALFAATLSAPSSAAPATYSPTGPATTATEERSDRPAYVTRAWKAQKALERAKAALSPTTAAERRPDATLALRRLWLLRDSLSRTDRLEAERLAARPVKPAFVDGANIRVHYNPAEMTPAFSANDVLNTLVHVSNTYAGSGYRYPEPDGALGGDSKTDVYVDTLPAGLYGYCTTDQPTLDGPGRFDVWAFCVVDNDYAGFPANTPVQNLQVTAAHEYYHAVQYAYDAAEDGWFMEATAVWAEDEVFDDVNDSKQYLRQSPITRPKRSMDKFGGVYHYGVWSFFRYLTERFPAETGVMPSLVLQMWKYADSSKGPRKDKYSTQAVAKALKKQHLSFDKAFARFSDANRRTHSVYDEGAALNYPVKKLAAKKVLRKKGASKRFTASLNHLSSATYRFTSKSLKNKKFKLRLTFDLAPKSAGSRAVVTTYKKNGKTSTKVVRLNGKGNGALKVKFSSKLVNAVEVTLVNASTRYRQCYQRSTPFACSGKPVDQHTRNSVLGRVVRG